MAANTKHKTLWITFGSIVAVIALVVILLSVIKPTVAVSLNAQDAPYSVLVMKSGSYDFNNRPAGAEEFVAGAEGEAGEDYKEFEAAYKKATSFSVGYGILDNVWFPSASIAETEEDGEKVFATKTVAEIKALAGSAESYLFVVRYEKKQSAKISSETIEYDRLFFFASDTSNQIEQFKFYLVDSDQMLSEDPQVQQEYEAYECIGYMNGTRLKTAIDDILA